METAKLPLLLARDYQLEQIDKAIEAVSSKRKVCVQLPTGGGKTFEFALLCERYIRATEKSVLILVHREELMKQAAKTIENLLHIKPYLITSNTSRFGMYRVYIGMVESTVKRTHLFDNVGLVIIDECHINNFNKIHNIFLEELIIGYTATPISSSKKEPVNKYYNKIVTGPQVSQLIEMGYLSQNITRCPKDVVDTTMLQIDKLTGDYNERVMSAEYRVPKHIQNVVKSYIKHCRGKKTIIFNVNIEHSKDVDECFRCCGFNSRHIDASSSTRPSIRPGFANEREEILNWFKITPDAILQNVMIATVGFDEPTIINVISNFSTLSLAKAMQVWGRGGRIIDQDFIDRYQKDYPYKLQLKSQFNIIDMGGNCIKFGDWNQDRDWEWIFNNPDIPGEGVAPVKTCPECEGLVHAAKMVCDLPVPGGGLCLYEFQKRKTAEEQDLEELILITKGIDVDSMASKEYKKHKYFTFLSMADPIVYDMFKKYGDNCDEDIKKRFFKAYYLKCCEWHDRTLAMKEDEIDDIRDSGWHIQKALNNFNDMIKKYDKQFGLNIGVINSETKISSLKF